MNNQSSVKARKNFDHVVFELCRAIDSPRSLAVWLLYSLGEHEQLVQLSIVADQYLDPYRFADDYLITKMLSKAEFLDLHIDRKAVALEKFAEAERQCARTNLRLARDPNGRYPGILQDAKRIVSRTIGESPNYDLVIAEAGWGPGVTLSSKGIYLSWAEKLEARVTATPLLAKSGAEHLIASIPGWRGILCQSPDASSCSLNMEIQTVPGNSVTTVPKNAKTERTIAVEPHLNAFLQRGIGRTMRKALLRAGLDLSDQGRNQEFARRGSIDGSYATIDLSSASDTVSQRLVETLLPDGWMPLLNCARSGSYTLNGSIRPYHKHSSMGNGYTFELESLIFWAICRAVLRHHRLDSRDCAVYGDDMIVPTSVAVTLIEVLRYVGFETNTSKTFVTGPFRESCGTDYFLGVSVQPFYVRKAPRHSTDWMVLANQIRRYANRRNGIGCDARFLRAWRVCLLAVPRNDRLLGPDGLGDGVFISDIDEAAHCLRPSKRRRNRLFCERYEVDQLVFVARRRVRTSVAGVLAALQAASMQPWPSDEPLIYSTARGVGRFVRRALPIREWPFIPWY